MTISDRLIDVALLLVVFRQLREERLTLRTILLPLALIGRAAGTYLHDIPRAGDDPVLIGALTGTGVAFGLSGGLITRVRHADWHIRVGATGAEHTARFSVDHDITGAQAWVAALVLTAFGEVVARLAVIVVRGSTVRTRAGLQARHALPVAS
ncbi:hypothetical protein [Streptomyces sp. NPDC003015]